MAYSKDYCIVPQPQVVLCNEFVTDSYQTSRDQENVNPTYKSGQEGMTS